MIGQTLSHFKITAKLGEGGMGEVYRAEDTSLGREVAIKVLPEAFVADEERLARFEREAKVLASLEHPNIAGIYEVGEADGTHFLAMQLAPGEDLSQLLEAGRPDLETTLSIALQIANAIEAAHSRGIVHRDLKPANVKVASAGSEGVAVKVLDFGLAKAWEDSPGHDGSMSLSPTLTAQMTQAGVILGTAGYMSPEQARGQEADGRSDVWAFGVILWEMLTGERLFGENTVSDTLAAVLKSEIDPGKLPLLLPHPLRHLVERCLGRDVKRRLQSIGEARIVLEDLVEGRVAIDATSAPVVTTGPWIRWLPVGLAVILLALGALWLDRDTPEPPQRQLRRFSVAMQSTADLTGANYVQIALSPDGQTLVSSATDDTFFLRHLRDSEGTHLTATEGTFEAFFSPDGRWIGFIRPEGLSRVAVAGGGATPIAIAEVGYSVRGVTWSTDGFIYYASALKGQLFKVSATGGDIEVLASPDIEAGEQQIQRPFALPSGNALLVHVIRDGRPPSIEAVDPTTGARKSLGLTGIQPMYAEGHILFGVGNGVLAAPFDAEALEVTGEPVPLVADVWVEDLTMQIALSREGTMAYLSVSRLGYVQPVLVTRDGGELPLVPSGFEGRVLTAPRFSPDGTRVLFQDITGVSILDIRSSTVSRVTPDGFYPVWSPDGGTFIHGATLSNNYDLVRRYADLRPEFDVLLDWDNPLRPAEWTQHGFIFREQIPDKGMDLKFLPADLEGEPQALLEDESAELAPTVSPDGRWVAFQSGPSGSDEIYVTSFPVSKGRFQISSGGGRGPLWSKQGGELFYFEGRDFIAATLVFDPNPRVIERQVLFSGDYYQYRWHRQYDIHPDGERFLMIKLPSGSGSVELVLDWTTEVAGRTSLD